MMTCQDNGDVACDMAALDVKEITLRSDWHVE